MIARVQSMDAPFLKSLVPLVKNQAPGPRGSHVAGRDMRIVVGRSFSPSNEHTGSAQAPSLRTTAIAPSARSPATPFAPLADRRPPDLLRMVRPASCPRAAAQSQLHSSAHEFAFAEAC